MFHVLLQPKNDNPPSNQSPTSPVLEQDAIVKETSPASGNMLIASIEVRSLSKKVIFSLAFELAQAVLILVISKTSLVNTKSG